MSRKENNSAGIQRRTGLLGKICEGCLDSVSTLKMGQDLEREMIVWIFKMEVTRVKKRMKIGVNKDISRGQ